MLEGGTVAASFTGKQPYGYDQQSNCQRQQSLKEWRRAAVELLMTKLGSASIFKSQARKLIQILGIQGLCLTF